MSKIFEATIGIVKMGNMISLNFPYTAWRYGRPEVINGKPMRFSSNGQNYDYTIRISDAQPENMMLMFTTNPDSLVGGQTYTITIYENEFPRDTATEEWRPMSRTETIQRGTDTINVSYLLPSQSYTEQGRDGVVLVTWEEKFVNGVTTGEKRNERRTTQTSVVNNKRYVGTKSETPIQPEPSGAVIDFRNVSQIFYENNEIQAVYYMGEKLWEKVVAAVEFKNVFYKLNYNTRNYRIDSANTNIVNPGSKQWIQCQWLNLDMFLENTPIRTFAKGAIRFKAYASQPKTITGFIRGSYNSIANFSFDITTTEQEITIEFSNLQSPGRLNLFFNNLTMGQTYYVTDIEVGEV